MIFAKELQISAKTAIVLQIMRKRIADICKELQMQISANVDSTIN